MSRRTFLKRFSVGAPSLLLFEQLRPFERILRPAPQVVPVEVWKYLPAKATMLPDGTWIQDPLTHEDIREAERRAFAAGARGGKTGMIHMRLKL